MPAIEFRSLSLPCPLIPILTVSDVDTGITLVETLVKAGYSSVEITLRNEAAMPLIRELVTAELPLLIGAGTVTQTAQLVELARLGIDFAVSPGLCSDLLRVADDNDLCLLPGIATASDMMAGHRMGYRDFKLFPAEAVGGVSLLRAFQGPFPQARFCPTGGLSADNVSHYLALSSVLWAGGSWMIDRNACAEGNWEQVYQTARISVERVLGQDYEADRS